jgi:hypothetical protein
MSARVALQHTSTAVQLSHRDHILVYLYKIFECCGCLFIRGFRDSIFFKLAGFCS